MSADPREAEVKAEVKEPGRRYYFRRREAVMLGLVGALLVGGMGLCVVARNVQQVWFINALDVPVTVEIDGARLAVEKGGRSDRRLLEGIHEVRVLSALGEVLEEGPIDVRRADVVAYNVLGAAPLYKANIIYQSSRSAQSGGDSRVEFLGAARLAIVANVNYVFVEPAQSISVESRTQGSVTRVAFDVGKGGWISTLNYLESERMLVKAASISRAVARAQPGDDKAFAYANHQTEVAEGIEGAIRFLRREKDRAPDSIDTNIAYAVAMRRVDRIEEVRVEYRARYQAKPDVPLNGVLLARVSPREEARGLYEELLKRHPDDALVRQGAASFAFFAERDYGKTVELLAKTQGTARYLHYLDDHVLSLVALGRVPEALALLSQFVSRETNMDMRLALLYAEIARQPGAGNLHAPARAYLDEIGKKPQGSEAVLWARSVLGDEVSSGDLAAMKNDNLRRTIELQVDALRDPSEARERSERASQAVFEQLHPGVALLLAAEFARVGAASLAARILDARREFPVPSSSLTGYVLTGTEHPELWRLEPEWRAALDFVRARRLQELGQSGEALEAAAERADLRRGVVMAARAAWPRVDRSAVEKGGKASGAGKVKPAGKAPTGEKAAAVRASVMVLRREKPR
jgi:hypothetical protein